MLIIFFIALQLAITSFLTGFIWFIQLVHYPLFKEIPIDSFPKYHHKHIKNTGIILFPTMIVEAVSVGFLVFLFPRGTEQYFLTMIGIIALGLIWISTFGLQLPRHLRLKLGHHMESINILIKTNWIRTGLWSLRLFVSFFTILASF